MQNDYEVIIYINYDNYFYIAIYSLNQTLWLFLESATVMFSTSGGARAATVTFRAKGAAFIQERRERSLVE